MDQFVLEIEAYAAAHGITPQKLLREVISAPWGQWQKWKDGSSTPTMRIVERLCDYMGISTSFQPAASAAQLQEYPHDQTSDA